MVRHSPQKKGIGAGRFSGREKKPVQVGSFRGPLAAATQHAEAAVSRLKGRAKNGHHCIPIRHDIEPSLRKMIRIAGSIPCFDPLFRGCQEEPRCTPRCGSFFLSVTTTRVRAQ